MPTPSSKPTGKVQPAEGLYTRTMHGTRPRYTLAHSHLRDWNMGDVMKAGEFRLVHAVGEGGYRYHYDVTPDTAAFVAASSIAYQAMVEAMIKAQRVQPSTGTVPYTQKQLRAIEQARDIMQAAGCFVTSWQYPGVHDIVRAGIAAVRKYEEKA